MERSRVSVAFVSYTLQIMMIMMRSDVIASHHSTKCIRGLLNYYSLICDCVRHAQRDYEDLRQEAEQAERTQRQASAPVASSIIPVPYLPAICAGYNPYRRLSLRRW